VVFSRALSSSSWTKPAIPTLLSGLHPITHGVGATSYTDRLPQSVPMLQDAFRSAGWRTGSFAASPLGSTLSGLERGFDAAYAPQHWSVSGGDPEHPAARQLHDALLAWLDEEPDRPFFAFVHTLETHEWRHERHQRDRQPDWDAYDAAVHDADQQLGELLAALEARGRRPLVVLLSDHGESFGEHGVKGHGTSLFQSQLHIPLMFFSRQALPPMTVTEPVSLLDVAPSILDLVGLPALPAQDGTSLASWVRTGRGSTAPTRSGVTSELTRFVWRPDAPKWRSLVALDGEKLIRIEGQAPLAFDLKRDPCETEPVTSLATKLLPALEARIAAESATHAEFAARHDAGPRAAVDAGDVERLRALGYVE
jgi:arylsulfatase A-like enzyme